MTEPPIAAPALYAPDDRLFTAAEPTAQRSHADLEESVFKDVYDIDRTVREIVEKGYRRVALQFPDELLGDSTRVYGLISRGINGGVSYYTSLDSRRRKPVASGGYCGGGGQSQENGCYSSGQGNGNPPNGTQKDSQNGCCDSQENCTDDIPTSQKPDSQEPEERKAFILADTSYSACCIDEIAAEHCSADVLVHYGRSCLSPTTRLPVIYVFTTNPLDLTLAASSFCSAFPDKSAKVILMADVTYTSHIPTLYEALTKEGYENVFATTVIHDPSSPLPNRTHPPSPEPSEPSETLRSYSLFHISTPLPSLLLVLASRVASIHTYAPNTPRTTSTTPTTLLRRRYALLSHARTAGIIGILINTLNVKNYLPMITAVKRQIHSAGRKSYLVVVGKVNVEKVANFPEVEVWVGIGCWEQGIVGSESGREFYRPVITPFELSMALDNTRVWTGEWITDFESLLRADKEVARVEGEDGDSEDEPPEFDLRTGKYVSTSRPLRQRRERVEKGEMSTALIASSDSAKQLVAGGVISPAAEFLRDKRSWRGLGSDFVIEYEKEEGNVGGEDGAVVEVGRSGVARGYTVGGEGGRH